MSRHLKVAAAGRPGKAARPIGDRRNGPAGWTATDERALERLRAEIQKGIDSPDDPDFSFDKLRATLDAEDRERKRWRSVNRARSRA